MATMFHSVFRFPSHWTARRALDYCSIPEPNSGCLLWTEGVNRDGYGRVTWRGKRVLAHRLSWAEANGPIPVDMVICHKCDVPSCINPDHLFMGTQADNRTDCTLKCRHHHGERHAKAKLTVAQAVLIRQETGLLREVAEKYGVSQNTISLIRLGKGWRAALSRIREDELQVKK